MTIERIEVLEKLVDGITKTVNALEKTVISLNASLEARVHAEVQLEQTLRNIDDNLRALNEKVLISPAENRREFKKELDPLHAQLRKHEDRFMQRRDLIAFLTVLVFFLTTFGIMSSYILLDAKDDLLSGQKHNKVLIEHNAQELRDHDAFKRANVQQ